MLLAFVWRFQNLPRTQIPQEASSHFWIPFWAQAWALAWCTMLESEGKSRCKQQWQSGYPRYFKVKLCGVNGAYESAHWSICWTGVFSIIYVCILNCFTESCHSCDHFWNTSLLRDSAWIPQNMRPYVHSLNSLSLVSNQAWPDLSFAGVKENSIAIWK